MEINETEMENDPGSLPPPRFDAAMISAAQQVEPLPTRRPLPNFLRGRVGVLITIMVALLLGAAAFGMFLGLRDRRNLIDETTTSNQATSEPTNDGGPATVLKSTSLKSPARAKPADSQAAELKAVAPVVRSLRSTRVRPSQVDQDDTVRSEQPAARKVGEIFADRKRDRHDRRDGSRRRERDDNNDNR